MQKYPLIEAWQQAEKELALMKLRAEEMMFIAFAEPVPTTLRSAMAKDIVEGALLWYPEFFEASGSFADSHRLYEGHPGWCFVGEVLRPHDPWKAFVAGPGPQEGARQGLEGAFVAV